MATYVLVHGAWHGGWCWQKVKALLEAQGHRVFTPTKTGLGERAHLMSGTITMDTLVEDIANVIRYEDLHEVILVGHSFGGTVISGVAEKVKERLRGLIYLDAAILENGESMFSQMPEEIVAERKALALESSNGLSLPVPNAKALGLLKDAHWDFVKARLTPQPLSTYDTPISLNALPGQGLPCRYIVCTQPLYEPLAWARERAKAYGWEIIKLSTGHDAMVSDPEGLVALLAPKDSVLH